MTLDIEYSRTVCQAATEGPWCNRWNEVAGDPDRNQRVVVAYPMSGEEITVVGLIEWDGENVAVKEPDAMFIAHARTALPEALDAIEAARAERDLALSELKAARAEIAKLKANEVELREEIEDYEVLNPRLRTLLIGTANAINGPPPELTSWSWADLPEKAQKLARVMKAAKAWCETKNGDVGTWIELKLIAAVEDAQGGRVEAS